MKNKISTNLTALITTALVAGLHVVNPISVHAVTNICEDSSVPQDVKEAANCFGNGDLKNVIVNILNGVIGALGIVAVVFVIIGGVQYMTSHGDSAKTKKAKDTILYACIGLVVCALAFIIVNFAIGIINKS